ncbi:MAG: hypothetical protein P4M01_06980 [Acidobacteriota bacterium]|nr:hypothetical protein [Acidobacteriota bacterium]
MRRAILMLLFLASWVPWATAQKSSHADYFEHYEGTKTCLTCHQSEAESFFHSQHYQWLGTASHIVNAQGQALGKMNTINDFCTNPSSNWIGRVENKKGDVITRGCSACHAGLGLKPSPEMTQAQLENIDCLQCHASGYRRDVYQNGKGQWEWRPILWENQEGLDSVAKRIGMPTRVTCLRCHANSGGGANFKRGDLEYALSNTTRDYDVHMGKDGANFDCINCHKGSDHHVRGRGADLSANDMKETVRCSECHKTAPHKDADLNRHMSRIDCTVCHIPTFARTDATDMVRDWSKPAYNAEKEKYAATITLETNVKPVYAWYNGNTQEQLLRQPLNRLADGSVGMMIPQGSRNDPKAKIFAFKLHRAKLPYLKEQGWILPIQVEEFFQTGELDKSIREAAEHAYGVKNPVYGWADTTRYMGIYHGVRPHEQALHCKDCHGAGGRMDWKALGYPADPNPTGAPAPKEEQ